MKKTTENATTCHNAPQPVNLTVVQENAIDALVSGKNDIETANLVGVHRGTVTRWRLYSPTFKAALNVRRAEVWSVGADRLQSLIPKALDVIADELEKPDNPNRLKAACELLKLVPLTAPEVGPIDPDEIIRQCVAEKKTELRRDREQKAFDHLLCFDSTAGPPIPSDAELTALVVKELDDRTNGTEAIGEPAS